MTCNPSEVSVSPLRGSINFLAFVEKSSRSNGRLYGRYLDRSPKTSVLWRKWVRVSVAPFVRLRGTAGVLGYFHVTPPILTQQLSFQREYDVIAVKGLEFLGLDHQRQMDSGVPTSQRSVKWKGQQYPLCF